MTAYHTALTKSSLFLFLLMAANTPRLMASNEARGTITITATGQLSFSKALGQFSLEVPVVGEDGEADKGFLLILENKPDIASLVGKSVTLKGQVTWTGPNIGSPAYLIMVQAESVTEAASSSGPIRLQINGLLRTYSSSEPSMQVVLFDGFNGTRWIINLQNVFPKVISVADNKRVQVEGEVSWLGPTRGPGGLIVNLKVHRLERTENAPRS